MSGRIIGVCLRRFMIAGLVALSGCEQSDFDLEPVGGLPELVGSPPLSTTAGSPAAGNQAQDAGSEAEVERLPGTGTFAGDLEGSGETVWAEGFEGLIAGLDGELYEAYHPVTIQRVQEDLRKRGLYAGPLNGILDLPTMKAIYVYQDASYGLQRCGVPTPRTRELLSQGSHT